VTVSDPVPLPSSAPEQILVSFNDIHFSQHWMVTPYANRSLKNVRLVFSNAFLPQQVTPAWTIVLAVLFFPLGLLFLLVKETRMAAHYQFTVTSDGFSYQTVIPAIPGNPMQFTDLQNRTNYVQSLIAAAA
jgi:hypothetical protein